MNRDKRDRKVAYYKIDSEMSENTISQGAITKVNGTFRDHNL